MYYAIVRAGYADYIEGLLLYIYFLLNIFPLVNNNTEPEELNST